MTIKVTKNICRGSNKELFQKEVARETKYTVEQFVPTKGSQKLLQDE